MKGNLSREDGTIGLDRTRQNKKKRKKVKKVRGGKKLGEKVRGR